MNREEAVIQLAQLSVVPALGDQTIGVLLPSFADVKKFRQELLAKLQEIPKWLSMPMVMNNTRYVEMENGFRIHFLHTVRSARGRTFNAFYISSRLTEKQKTQYVFDLLPAMVHSRPILTFDDE